MSKIRELIIILSEQQEKELIKRAEAAGIDDDLAHLQSHISDWLRDDSARLSHNEK